jgi:pseudouridine-5'-phosphate glycosidase/pseudouridine kinase
MLAMADMDILTEHSFPTHWASVVAATKPEWLVIDANWAAEDMHAWIRVAKQNHARIAFEPVSNAKAARLFAPVRDGVPLGVYPNASVDLATPNEFELTALYDAAKQGEHFESAPWFDVIDAFGIRGGARDRFVQITSAAMTDAGIPQRTVQLLPYMPTIVTKLGASGALLTAILGRDDPRLRDPRSAPYLVSRTTNDRPHIGGVYMRLFSPGERVEDVVSVNGVGDTFLGVLIAGLAQGGRVENLIDVAQKGAAMTLRSNMSVSADLATLRDELAAAAARE